MIARIRSLAVDAVGQLAVDGDRHGLEGRQRQRLGGQHVLDLAGADAERQRAEGAVGGGVAVTADHGGAGLGQSQLRSHDVDDALLDVAQRVQPDAELRAVLAQRLQLGARDRVGDRLVDVEGRGVVVLGGDGEVGTAHLAAGLAEAVERLRAGHLVQQVQIDEEEVGLALRAPDDMVVPDLLRECPSHRFPSGRPQCRPCSSVRDARSIPLPGRAPGRGPGPRLQIDDVPRKIELAFHSVRREYRCMDNSSGVGVLDKAALVLSALESGPATLAGLVAATGLARPTAHRLAVALEHHRMVARDMQGRFILGPRLAELAAAAGEDRLLATAGPVLTHLRDVTGRERPALPPPGRHADLRGRGGAAVRTAGHRPGRLHAPHEGGLGGPDPDGLGGAGAAAPRPPGRPLHGHRAVRRTAPRLGPVDRRAGAGRGLGLRARARAPPTAWWPPSRSPDRSSG